MIGGKRVEVVTPAGRRRPLAVLAKYMRRDLFRGIVDRWQVWRNTEIAEDLTYIDSLAALDGVTVVRPDEGFSPGRIPEGFAEAPGDPLHWHWNTGHFFRRCVDPETVYIRLDDDICWIAEDAIESLARHRIEDPKPFLIFPNVVNNPHCDHLHQQMGALSTGGGMFRLTFNHRDPSVRREHGDNGWHTFVHSQFLAAIHGAETNRWKFASKPLPAFDFYVICAFAFSGADFVAFGGDVPVAEEEWLSVTRPQETKRPNEIYGGSLMAHLSFQPQHEWVENSEIMRQYEALAEVAWPTQT